jgi:hypothetical protein
LNGDGVIGVSATPVSQNTISHAVTADAFLFREASDSVWNAGRADHLQVDAFHFASFTEPSMVVANLAAEVHQAPALGDAVENHAVEAGKLILASLYADHFIIH